MASSARRHSPAVATLENPPGERELQRHWWYEEPDEDVGAPHQSEGVRHEDGPLVGGIRAEVPGGDGHGATLWISGV